MADPDRTPTVAELLAEAKHAREQTGTRLKRVPINPAIEAKWAAAGAELYRRVLFSFPGHEGESRG